MDIFVIWIDPSDDTKGAQHQHTHPHLLHVYSEADECDHSFRVHDQTTLGHVFDEFYRRSQLQPTELDRFKCEATGEDLLPFREETFARLLAEGHCSGLEWIFSNRPIRIFVDTQPKEVNKKQLSFTEVVSLAYGGNPPQGDNWAFTVGYTHGPRENPEGSLTKGHSVKIKDGMRFDVSATNES